MTNNLIQQYNLEQLIHESTHYTGHSESLIDCIMVSDKSNVLFSGVYDNQIRYTHISETCLPIIQKENLVL